MTARPAPAAMLALLLTALTPLAALADAAAGAQVAQRWCANCHVIDGAGPSASVPQGPPSFHVIAGHLDADQMRAFLANPHGAMPNLALSRAEIADLIDYIQSLR